MPKSSVDEVAEYYAARAPTYDETAGYTEPSAERLREPIKARYQELLRGRDVLEVACGTGYWTKVIAEAARSVIASDVNSSMIDLARRRLRWVTNVRLKICDAYSLHGIPSGFTAGMAVWWWSHMPKVRIPQFLSALHQKLIPGAIVLFVDQLPSAYKTKSRRLDATGDMVEERTLPDGRRFLVVKNFPTEEEIFRLLRGIAQDIAYREFPEEHSWSLTYRVMEERQKGPAS